MSKPATVTFAGISLPETYLLGKRHPVSRWHDLFSGVDRKLWEPSCWMITERYNKQILEAESRDANRWGGFICSSEEASVMGVERRDEVNAGHYSANFFF